MTDLEMNIEVEAEDFSEELSDEALDRECARACCSGSPPPLFAAWARPARVLLLAADLYPPCCVGFMCGCAAGSFLDRRRQ